MYNMIHLSGIMLSNKAGCRKYIQNDSIYIKFQNMLNEIILFRNPNKCGKNNKGKEMLRNIKF